MEWIFENPLPALVIGGLTTAILISGWLQTGRSSLAYLAGIAVALTIGAVILERMVVTDREEVQATLFEIARLVENNQIEQALEYAHELTPEVRRQAAAELALYEFESIDIKRNLQIEVFPDHVPPRATAEFNVVVTLSTRVDIFRNQRIPRYIEMTLFREADGVWRVGAYQHYDARRGWTNDSFR